MKNKIRAGGTVSGEAGLKALGEAANRMAPLQRSSSSKKGKRAGSSESEGKSTKIKKENEQNKETVHVICGLLIYIYVYMYNLYTGKRIWGLGL